jgi:hypothetical protein
MVALLHYLQCRDLQWPPFRKFSDSYYTYQLLLDLKVGKDWPVRTGDVG